MFRIVIFTLFVEVLFASTALDLMVFLPGLLTLGGEPAHMFGRVVEIFLPFSEGLLRHFQRWCARVGIPVQ